MFNTNSNAYNSDLTINPSSSSNGSYLDFPSHLLDDDDLFLGAIFPYQTPPPPPPPPQPSLPQPLTTKDEQKGLEKGKRKRATTKGGGGPKMRKSGKKDRHSKINTVHGPRDRRMRLSLQIARKFFDLQDMLGFDKASKTIEWLFNKSKAAIKDLADKSSSCTTSILQEEEVIGGCTNSSNYSNFDNDKKKNKQLLSQRENRERARARARERTKEKLLIKQMKQNPSNNTNMEILRVEDNSQIIQKYRFEDDHDEQQQLEDQMASVAIIEKFLTTSSSFFDFDNENYQRNMGVSDALGLPDFAGDWMTENSRISSAFMD